MTIFGRPLRRDSTGDTIARTIARRDSDGYGGTVDDALRHSAVWAGRRLRADLVSSLPVHFWRQPTGTKLAVEVDAPGFFQQPDAGSNGFDDWRYCSQGDLDTYGNTVGIIARRDAANRPLQIELQDMATVSIVKKDGVVRFRIGRKMFDQVEVWHERQYPVSGYTFGLSPIGYARTALTQATAAQQFGIANYRQAGRPNAHLMFDGPQENEESDIAKVRFLSMMGDGGLFVSGNDWEFKPIEAAQADMAWLDAQKISVVEIARYLGVPVDLIDGAVSGQSVTYANIAQRNMQFLIMQLGPALGRREKRWSRYLTPNGMWCEFVRDALLAMDPQTRADVIDKRIRSAQLSATEARGLENRLPFTLDEWVEYDRIMGRPNTPTTAKAGATQ